MDSIFKLDFRVWQVEFLNLRFEEIDFLALVAGAFAIQDYYP